MTATMELGATAIEQWAPPRVLAGQVVEFYPYGQRNGRTTLAQVKRCKGRTCTVRDLETGKIYQSCRHVDDPKLAISDDLRQDGGWDFTEDERQRQAELQDFRDRLRILEGAVLRGGEREFLLMQAKVWGIPGVQKKPSDTIKKLIAEARKQAEALHPSVVETVAETAEPEADAE